MTKAFWNLMKMLKDHMHITHKQQYLPNNNQSDDCHVLFNHNNLNLINNGLCTLSMHSLQTTL